MDGDLIFTCWGTINQVGLIDRSARYRRYVISNKQMKLTVDLRKASSLFLYYWFSGPDGQAQILGGGIGSSVPGFNLGQLREMRVPMPPLDQQQTIASILGALDDKIDLNRRMNETLEAMARAIFQDWFVTFGPTRAKQEGRPPYLAADLWSLLPNRLDDDGKPEGWNIQPLSDLALITRDTISPALFAAEEFAHFSLPAYDNERRPVRETGGRIRSNKTVVPPDAVLLSKLNPEIPRVWFPDADTGLRNICSTEFLVFVPRVSEDRAFLYTLFSGDGFRERIVAMVTGTSKSHQRVNSQSVLTLGTVLPHPSVRRAFDVAATPLLDRVLANRRENETLAATRDLLLPKLMSGELRVKDAKRAVEEVA